MRMAGVTVPTSKQVTAAVVAVPSNGTASGSTTWIDTPPNSPATSSLGRQP